MSAITGISHVDLSVTDVRSSETWYRELLGLIPLFAARNDDHHLEVSYLVEPGSMLVIGLNQHDATGDARFDERQVGLDHLSFGVGSREELDSWLAKLDERGVPHSGIAERDSWDVLVLRDPDNIQLEFFHLKVDPATLLPS